MLGSKGLKKMLDLVLFSVVGIYGSVAQLAKEVLVMFNRTISYIHSYIIIIISNHAAYASMQPNYMSK